MSKLKSVPLSELVLVIQSGFACGDLDSNGVAQIRMNNITTSGQLDLSSITRVPKDAANNIDRYYLKTGDILFNSTNSPNLVGKTALFTEQSEPFAFSNHFYRIVVDPVRLAPSYLSRWLTQQQQYGVFEVMCTQWVNQASIRKEDLLSLQIPLPPLPEQ